MGRFEQRLRARLKNPEFASGYREMTAEIDLIRALDEAREQLHISKEELATRTGKRRESVSRLLNTEEANPTLDTITGLVSALGLTADITLRRAENDEAPIKVTVAL
jgi:transcriptional regulator with XRE-family HTH domain